MRWRDYLAGLSARDAALIVGANAIPLLGVFLAGWDAFTLLMLYWFESAIIGFWVCVAVLFGRERLEIFGVSGDKALPSGVGAALFIAAHAGIFMFVHLFFLVGFRSFSGGFDDVPQVLVNLVVDAGLWLPISGLFLLRGLITITDRAAGRPLAPTIVAFYLRIIVMQFVVLFGGFVAILFGGSLVPLLVLIVLRAALDIGIDPLALRVGLGGGPRKQPADAG